MPGKHHITTIEAARRLGMSPGRVRFYIKEGLLPAIRPARDYKLDPRDVESFRPRPNGRPATAVPRVSARCAKCGRVLRQANGRTLCWTCKPDKQRLQRAAESARMRRADRRAAGVCTECGLRRPETGLDYCSPCRTANLKRHRNTAA